MTLAAPLTRPEEKPPPSAARRHVAAQLGFRRGGGRSFLARQHTPHPFHLTRPFYLPDDPQGMATLYLQSSSGGLYGDDDLHLGIALEDAAAAHVTTQASTIVHAGRGGTTQQSVSLDCAPGSLLEYLPDPLILFTGARLRAKLTVQLAHDATLVFADAFLAHDPEAGRQGFDAFENDIVVRRCGEPLPLLIERQRLGKGLGLAGYACHGSLCVVANDGLETVAAAMKRQLAESGLAVDACYGAVNALPERGYVWARFLCRDGAALSTALDATWRGARLALTGRLPAPRRK